MTPHDQIHYLRTINMELKAATVHVDNPKAQDHIDNARKTIYKMAGILGIELYKLHEEVV